MFVNQTEISAGDAVADVGFAVDALDPRVGLCVTRRAPEGADESIDSLVFAVTLDYMAWRAASLSQKLR